MRPPVMRVPVPAARPSRPPNKGRAANKWLSSTCSATLADRALRLAFDSASPARPLAFCWSCAPNGFQRPSHLTGSALLLACS